MILLLAWGAITFGAVYPWGYWPLLIAATLFGFWGVLFGATLPRHSRGVTFGLCGLAVAVSLQLVPLPENLLVAIGSTVALVRESDLSVAVSQPGTIWHPISIMPQRTLLGLAFLIAFSLLCMGTAAMVRRSTLVLLTDGLVLLGSALALIALVQKQFYDGRVLGFWQPLNSNAEPYGPFINKHHFAGWMLMALPVVVGASLTAAARARRQLQPNTAPKSVVLASPQTARAIAIAFAAAVMCLSLLLADSRSGTFGALFLSGLAAFALLRARQPRAKRLLHGVLACSALAILVARAGIDVFARFAAADVADLGGRLEIWRIVTRMIADSWLTGTGLNTFGTASLYYEGTAGWTGRHLREAHNDYLQLAAEGGLLLWIPVVVTLGALSYAAVRNLRAEKSSAQWIRKGAVAGLAAISLQSLAEFSLQMPGNAALCAVLCGIVLRSPEIRRSTGAS